MGLEHAVVVHLVDVVAGQHQHVFRVKLLDEREVLEDRVRGALVPLAGIGGGVGRQHVHAAVAQVQIPGLAGADVAVQLQRTVLGQHADGVDVGIGAVRQREVDDAILSAEGHGRLCHDLGQQPEAAPLTAGQKHGDTLLFLHIIPTFCCLCDERDLRP